jgi:cGMP-dependent protein kinase
VGAEAFDKVVQGPIKDYIMDRIRFQNTNVPMDSLTCVQVVGRGGFGVVKMVKHKVTQTRYALKCVNIKQAVERRQQRALVLERTLLAELDHPFLIKFIRSFVGRRYVYFLMELVTGGELVDALYSLGLLNKEKAQFYIGSISMALDFLHQRQIAYLDLKGENCLIDIYGYLKIIDFGIAERVKNGRIYAMKGTPHFMAPEVILGKGYNTTADLWSLGVCLYDFMIGQFPFADAGASQSEILRAVLRNPISFPKWLQKEPTAIEVMKGLLTRDPAHRLGAGPGGFTEIKEHAFFSDFDWDGLQAKQLKAPFLPTKETYAEDAGEPLKEDEVVPVEEDENEAEDEKGWVDPDPKWQDDF